MTDCKLPVGDHVELLSLTVFLTARHLDQTLMASQHWIKVPSQVHMVSTTQSLLPRLYSTDYVTDDQNQTRQERR